MLEVSRADRLRFGAAALRHPEATMPAPRWILFTAGLLFAGLGMACSSGSDLITGSDTFEPQFSKPGGCPDHPSCGSGGGSGGEERQVTLDISGNVIAAGQGAAIEKESNARLTLVADTDFTDELSLLAAADFPSPGSLGACVTDPADLESTDPVALQDLIDRFDDTPQLRKLAVNVNLNNLGQPGGGGSVFHTWNDYDGDGNQYRTRVTESFLRRGDAVTVELIGVDTYRFTGGSVVSWNTSTDQAIACPNTGTVTIAITR
jgi:hypothetical protein